MRNNQNRGWKWNGNLYNINNIQYLPAGAKKVTAASSDYLVYFYPLTIVSNVFMRNGTCPLMFIGRVYNSLKTTNIQWNLENIWYLIYHHHHHPTYTPQKENHDLFTNAYLAWVGGELTTKPGFPSALKFLATSLTLYQFCFFCHNVNALLLGRGKKDNIHFLVYLKLKQRITYKLRSLKFYFQDHLFVHCINKVTECNKSFCI